jgi:hypothetical protein
MIRDFALIMLGVAIQLFVNYLVFIFWEKYDSNR